jgi:hypothetical protein
MKKNKNISKIISIGIPFCLSLELTHPPAWLAHGQSLPPQLHCESRLPVFYEPVSTAAIVNTFSSTWQLI